MLLMNFCIKYCCWVASINLQLLWLSSSCSRDYIYTRVSGKMYGSRIYIFYSVCLAGLHTSLALVFIYCRQNLVAKLITLRYHTAQSCVDKMFAILKTLLKLVLYLDDINTEIFVAGLLAIQCITVSMHSNQWCHLLCITQPGRGGLPPLPTFVSLCTMSCAKCFVWWSIISLLIWQSSILDHLMQETYICINN